MKPDRGARALAERLHELVPERFQGYSGFTAYEAGLMTSEVLGKQGLFIADVSKHEPKHCPMDWISCKCGYDQYAPRESYFDHLNEGTE